MTYALILAGGRGERLRPLTDSLPKPMVPLNGKPLLWHQVQWMKDAGVTDVVFLAGYRHEAVMDYFGDGSDHGFNAHYSIEDSPLGTGGAVKKGMSLVPETEESVVVTNGDIVTAEQLSAVMDRHRKRLQLNPDHAATVMVTPFVSPYGIVEVNTEDLIGGFREKAQLPHWINAGIYVFSRAVQQGLPDVGAHEDSTFPELARAGLLGAFRSTAFWRSVDSHKDLREAEAFLSGADAG